jgi:hypothetical protein
MPFPLIAPHAKQQPFIDAILDPANDIAAVCAGRGFGKSNAAVWAIGSLIYESDRCKLGRGWCVTINNIQCTAAEDAFEEVMGFTYEGGVIIEKIATSHAYELDWPGHKKRFRIEFKSAEREKSLRGRQVDFLWIDESAQLPEDSVDAALKVVLKSGGPVFHTTTPRGKNWFYEKIFRKSDLGDLGGATSRIKFFFGKTGDNPHLSERAQSMIVGQSSAHDYAQETLGQFKADPEGLVYPFDEEKMVFSPTTIITVKDPMGVPKEMTIDELDGEMLAGVDFGFSDPFVYIWVKKTKKANGEYRYFVMDMIYKTKTGIDNLVPLIQANKYERGIYARYADPGDAHNRDFLARKGKPTSMAVKDWEYGQPIVATYMQRGDVLIAEHLKEAIAELGTYEWSRKISSRPKSGQMDHFCDALRYVLASEETLNSGTKSGYSIAHDDGMCTVVDANGQRTTQPARNVSVYTAGEKQEIAALTQQQKWIHAIETAKARWKPADPTPQDEA